MNYQIPGSRYGVVIMQNAAAAIGSGTSVQCMDAGDGAGTTISMQIAGTFVATVKFEATIDGSDWEPISCTNLTDGTSVTSATSVGIFRLTCMGLVAVRARLNSYTSGAVTITAVGEVLGEYIETNPLNWLLRDEFTTDRAAGAVNGTAAEPGPGTRTVVDTAGGVSISGGALQMSGNTATGNPGYWLSPLSGTVTGRIVVLSHSGTAGVYGPYFGFDTDQTPGVNTRIVSGRSSSPGIWSNRSGEHFAWQIGVWKLAMILRGGGGIFFLALAPGATTWILTPPSLDSVVAATSATIQSLLSNNPSSISFVRVPDELWLPTPLISDGFGSAFGVSDGIGHQEGIAGGIGAGGSGVAWTGSTWSVVGGKAVNTPTLGAELVVNGGFATDTDWTKGTGWSIGGGVAVFSPGTSSFITQTGASTPGWYRHTFTIATLSAFGFSAGWGTSAFTYRSAVGTYTEVRFSSTIRPGVYASSPSTNGTVDNVSLKSISLNELFCSAPVNTADVLVGVNIVLTVGSPAGLVLNLDSTSSPANFVLAYHDGTTAKLEKCVAGVYTTLVNVAATYSPGARLVVQKNGTKYRLYYNNVFIGTEQTISDAGIISNTRHGLFSTDAGNTLDDFVAYPTGTGGEYAALERYSFD